MLLQNSISSEHGKSIVYAFPNFLHLFLSVLFYCLFEPVPYQETAAEPATNSHYHFHSNLLLHWLTQWKLLFCANVCVFLVKQTLKITKCSCKSKEVQGRGCSWHIWLNFTICIVSELPQLVDLLFEWLISNLPYIWPHVIQIDYCHTKGVPSHYTPVFLHKGQLF